MSQPFLSEIRIFSFNFAPKGWAFCNGQTMPIQQNTALFSLLGTTYGGDGVTNFKLPNLQGNVGVHFGNGYSLGETAGVANYTLNVNEIPLHTHTFNVSGTAGTEGTPAGAIPAGAAAAIGNAYGPGPGNVAMAPQTLGNTGGSLPHNNLQPYLVLTACIALSGIFPTRS